MIDIKHFVTSYELSDELDSYKLPLVLYEGCFIYDKLEKGLFVVVDYGNDKVHAVAIDSDKIFMKDFKENQFIKAYTAAELGELLPNDYTLPIPTPDGWAFVGEDGDIYTDDFYETETEARMSYLLYFLKHKVFTIDDLIKNNGSDV